MSVIFVNDKFYLKMLARIEIFKLRARVQEIKNYKKELKQMKPKQKLTWEEDNELLQAEWNIRSLKNTVKKGTGMKWYLVNNIKFFNNHSFY